ncbi:MAG: PAS domain-containing protein [Alphaproteobacteria bacterium]|nr:PAS domain-containing protein [Alphaproteobacteria bacterium]
MKLSKYNREELLKRKCNISLEEKLIELETANKKLKEQLKLLKEEKIFYEDFYENAPDMFLSINTPIRNILKCNQTLIDKLGYTQEELLKMKVTDLYHPDCIEKSHALRKEFIENGFYTNAELQLRKKNGEKLYIVSSATGIRNKEGQIIKSRVAWRDITSLVEARRIAREREIELYNANRSLNKANSALRNINKDLKSLMYIASHDLKSPLRTIYSFCQLIGQEPGDTLSHPSQMMLEQVRKKAKYMDKFIKDILQYYQAGLKTPHLETVVIEDLLHEIIEMLDWPKGCIFEFKSKVVTLITARAPLYQIFHNLISNAIYHHNNPSTAIISVICESRPLYLEFAVKDNGPGIPRKYHKKIFQPFQKLGFKTRYEGSGIGLSLVKKLVESHGGTINVESAVGKSTTFKFTWPYQPFIK